MKKQRPAHIIIVETYDGQSEFLSGDVAERSAIRGLGLPLEEIAECLDCRITVLCWDAWLRWEQTGQSFFSWMPAVPATRLKNPVNLSDLTSHLSSPRVEWMEILARDPDQGLPFKVGGLSPLSYGLLAESDPLFFLSFCLNQTLAALHRRDPFEAVIVPMYGGLGYVVQMARATRVDNCVDVPIGVVVTDTSTRRQLVNQEGVWNRKAVTRRQMEDLSLALADLTLVFGPRGAEITRRGRLSDGGEPVYIPRQVPLSLLDAIEQSAKQPNNTNAPIQIFLEEPQEPASGILLTLDAVTHLKKQNLPLRRPIVSAGPTAVFAPMTPRDFVQYWSSRGFVRELMVQQQWKWQADRPPVEDMYPVRLYPSLFEHLPFIWSELAQGSCVFLSPASAEGIAVDETIQSECMLPEEPDTLADTIWRIARADVKELDRIRRRLCEQVAKAHRGQTRVQMLKRVVGDLRALCLSPPRHQDLARVARLLLDRRNSLQTMDKASTNQPIPRCHSNPSPGSLSVVVTCFEMGKMLIETVRSVWSVDCLPDEVLLVDDGSYGEETLRAISDLEREAVERCLPFTVIRQHNQGLSAARNVGLESATGEFISFLDGDDVIEPQFYRMAIQLLLEYPDLGGVAAWAFCEGPGDQIGFWNAPQPELPLLFTENTVFIPCVIRRTLLGQLGGYDDRQRYNYEDWELSCRMLASGWPIITIPEYLQRYRIRSGSMFRSMTQVQNQVMRELFLGKHRETVSRFAMEIAMLTENRLMKEVYSKHGNSINGSGYSPSAVINKLTHLARVCVGATWRRLKTGRISDLFAEHKQSL